MDIVDESVWSDATLLRPAVDPVVPRAARELLYTPGTPLTPAGRPRPSRRPGLRGRGLLPDDPEQREETIYGATNGLFAAMAVAVTGSTPWAIGELIFQGPAGWQSATGQYSLVLGELIAAVTLIVFGTRVARSGGFRVRYRAAAAARAYHGRYLTELDLDARGRVLLRRVQDAIDTVRSAQVTRAGVLDEATADMALAAQEWDIAVTLREHADLRARRAAAGTPPAGSPAAGMLAEHQASARAADESVARRVLALERYAGEVRAADAAVYGHWRQQTVIAELREPHLDMLARTAADEHGIAELDAMTERARAIRESFDPPGSAPLTGSAP
jgi:hypothetical protein